MEIHIQEPMPMDGKVKKQWNMHEKYACLYLLDIFVILALKLTFPKTIFSK